MFAHGLAGACRKNKLSHFSVFPHEDSTTYYNVEYYDLDEWVNVLGMVTNGWSAVDAVLHFEQGKFATGGAGAKIRFFLHYRLADSNSAKS